MTGATELRVMGCSSGVLDFTSDCSVVFFGCRFRCPGMFGLSPFLISVLVG